MLPNPVNSLCQGHHHPTCNPHYPSAPPPVSATPTLVNSDNRTDKPPLGSKDEDKEELTDWPEGYERRERVEGQQESLWSATKFAWHSNGYSKRDDSANGKVESRSCLGVFQCRACLTPARPKTRKTKEQFASGCPCGGEFTWSKCEAKTYHFSVWRDRIEYLVWEHEGSHKSHKRPPAGRLTKSEWDAVGNQAGRHHEATALQLRNGDLGPGSVPLAKIAPNLANARAARYAIQKIRDTQGISSKTQKSAASVLRGFADLKKDLSTPFLIDSGVDGPIYIVMVTPFMAHITKEAIEDWIRDPDEGPSAGRHGFVTDGDHKFFRQGNLLVTSAWSSVLMSWVPIVYSWVDSLDADHHRPHFRALFQAILEYAGDDFDKKFFANVRSIFRCLLSITESHTSLPSGDGLFGRTNEWSGTRVCDGYADPNSKPFDAFS